MPSLYSLVSSPEEVRAVFGLEKIEPFPPRATIAPTEPVGIVRRSLHGTREFHLVRWGLIPGWVKDPRDFATLPVARAETASEKPSFRGGMRHRRCLVPADGFYGWSNERGERRPHLLRKADSGLMAFAAIADHWMGADGSEMETMAILTVASDGMLASVVERLPVILEPGTWDQWLDCRSGEASSVAGLLGRPGKEMLVAEEVAGPLPRRTFNKRDASR